MPLSVISPGRFSTSRKPGDPYQGLYAGYIFGPNGVYSKDTSLVAAGYEAALRLDQAAELPVTVRDLKKAARC